MRKTFKIVLDCDDVLLDCNWYAIQKLNKEKGTDYNLDDIHKWGIMDNALDERLSYFSDPSFMGSIPSMPGAVDFIVNLQKKGEVFICTSVSPNCTGTRIDSIVRHFPMIPVENILIGSRKDLIHADVILDDGYHNLQNSNVAYPVLFRRPWNHNITGVASVSNYQEFLALIDILKQDFDLDAEPKEVLALVGPSGSGKTTIANRLTVCPEFFESVVTYTTRKPRDEDDRYHFVTRDEFFKMRDQNLFFETASYQGEYYGTKLSSIKDIIEQKKTAVLVVDINGAIALKKQFGNKALTVFVKRSKEECIRSILQRGMSREDTVKRLVSMEGEFLTEELCDITIHNTTTNKAVEDIMQYQFIADKFHAQTSDRH